METLQLAKIVVTLSSPFKLIKVLKLFKWAVPKWVYQSILLELWSSGYGRRLIFQRSWVRIPAPYTRWTFFTFICCENFNVCWKDENKQKEAGVGQFFFFKKPLLARPKWIVGEWHRNSIQAPCPIDGTWKTRWMEPWSSLDKEESLACRWKYPALPNKQRLSSKEEMWKVFIESLTF